MGSSVVVVGGGPAGVLLTYLLARGGAAVTLLESRGDFDRRFRGDTIAPGVLEYLDDLGLAGDLLAEVPHARSDAFRWHTPGRTYRLVDYRGASRRFPFYALIPQAKFLPWLAEGARRHGAEVVMGARMRDLRRDRDGRVSGVEYTTDGQRHTLDADLVVGADGRSSRMRTAAGIEPTELGASLDLLWFAVDQEPDDPSLSGLDLFASSSGTVALLDQGGREWQVGWSVPAGSFTDIRTRGVAELVHALEQVLPWLGPRVRRELTDPNQLSLLPVRITTVETWSRPGVLLLGDAAHVISPVGGNGINLALADAAESANLLVGPLRRGAPAAVLDAAAAALERRRRPSTEREQRRQVATEASTVRRRADGDPRPPAVLRAVASLPGLPWLFGRRSGVRMPPPVEQIATATP